MCASTRRELICARELVEVAVVPGRLGAAEHPRRRAGRRTTRRRSRPRSSSRRPAASAGSARPVSSWACRAGPRSGPALRNRQASDTRSTSLDGPDRTPAERAAGSSVGGEVCRALSAQARGRSPDESTVGRSAGSGPPAGRVTGSMPESGAEAARPGLRRPVEPRGDHGRRDDDQRDAQQPSVERQRHAEQPVLLAVALHRPGHVDGRGDAVDARTGGRQRPRRKEPAPRSFLGRAAADSDNDCGREHQETTRTKIRWLRYEYSAFNTLHPPMPISGSNHYMATLRVEPGVGLQGPAGGRVTTTSQLPYLRRRQQRLSVPTRFPTETARGAWDPKRMRADHRADVRNDLGGCPRGSGRQRGCSIF